MANTVVVRASTKLDQSVLKKIETYAAKLSGGSVTLKVIVDPSLIGGYVLDIVGREYDYSIAGQLKRLEASL